MASVCSSMRVRGQMRCRVLPPEGEPRTLQWGHGIGDAQQLDGRPAARESKRGIIGHSRRRRQGSSLVTARRASEQASKQASERARVSKQSGRGRRTPAGHRSLLLRELPAARRDTRKQARTLTRHAHVRRTGSHLSSDASKYHQRADASKYQTCADGVVQQTSGDQHGVWMGAAKAVEARRRVRTLALATTRLFICQGRASPSAHA